MAKVVLELSGKRCKFVAIEKLQRCGLHIGSVFDGRGRESLQSQVPRVFSCDASAYYSADQLIPDP
jgi:hypothetical protein